LEKTKVFSVITIEKVTNVRSQPFRSQRVTLTIFCNIFGSYRDTFITYLSSPIYTYPVDKFIMGLRDDVKLNEVSNSMAIWSLVWISIK